MTAVDTMAGRLARIQQRIAEACARAGRPPESVTLLPVSKTFGVEAIREAMALGLTRFGENKTQEIRQKAAALAGEGLQWVLIGHLQTNKARDAARDAAHHRKRKCNSPSAGTWPRLRVCWRCCCGARSSA